MLAACSYCSSEATTKKHNKQANQDKDERRTKMK